MKIKMTKKNIAKMYKIWFVIPAVIILAAMIVFAGFAIADRDINSGMNIGTDFASGTPLTLFLHTPLYELIPAGCMLLFGLFSALHVLSEFYTTGMKPRFIFIFNMTALLLTTLLLGGPDAARNDACLIAVPASLLIPFSFVRINRAIVWPLYLLLAASAVISSILQ